MNTAALYQVYLSHPVVTTDSRRCPEGSMFFALKGTNFNGNTFAKKALEDGCAVAVVDDPAVVPADDDRFIVVADVLNALQDLAAFHRKQFKKPVLQITGTNGKTTTKELVAAVLGERFNVLYTQGNLNNHIGVPLTLLRIREEHDIAVIETGANHPGEIAFLTELVQPDYGLITNVGHAHIEGFGSFEGVKRTKGELYDFLKAHDGCRIFSNGSDATLTAMLNERGIDSGAKCIVYGNEVTDASTESDFLTDPAAEPLDTVPFSPVVCGQVTDCNPFVKMRWCKGCGDWHEVQTHLIGAYNIANLLAAACVGTHFGVSEEQVCHALSTYEPTLGRSEYRQTDRNALIIDAYNANLTSMHAALANFRQIPAARKMLILGDMRELGTASDEAHNQILDEALTCGAESVWLVGAAFGKAAERAGARAAIRLFADVNEVKAALSAEKPSGWLILIKGSNSTRLAETVGEL